MRVAPPAPGREREEDDGRRRRPRSAPKTNDRDEVEDARQRERADDRACDRLAVRLAEHVVLVALAEAQPVVRGGREVEDERDRRADERAVVDVPLRVVRSRELAREG